MSTDIFNQPKIDAATDAAIAAEPTDLPEVGTMVIVEGFMMNWPAIVTRCGNGYAHVLSISGDNLEDVWKGEWIYATPEQRAKAWEGK